MATVIDPKAGGSEWKTRLIEERKDLLAKTIKLKKAFDNPALAMSNKEWEMLHEQFHAMRNYLQILTDRCIFYGLMESGDLGIHY